MNGSSLLLRDSLRPSQSLHCCKQATAHCDDVLGVVSGLVSPHENCDSCSYGTFSAEEQQHDPSHSCNPDLAKQYFIVHSTDLGLIIDNKRCVYVCAPQ